MRTGFKGTGGKLLHNAPLNGFLSSEEYPSPHCIWFKCGWSVQAEIFSNRATLCELPWHISFDCIPEVTDEIIMFLF